MGIDAVIYAHTELELTDKEIKETAWRLADAMGHETFWSKPKDGRFALTRVSRDSGEDDRDLPIPTTGTTLTVNQLWRYYGPGYERGPIDQILVLDIWLTRNGFTMWYGSDSGGAEGLTRFAEVRDELEDRFALFGHYPYNGYFDQRDPKANCPYCEMPMHAYFFGAYHSFTQCVCPGCGTMVRTSDGGQTFVEVDREGNPT